MTTARYATALTGGTAGALDAKAIATLADGDIAWVATGSVLYVYKFVAAATDAESSPSRIRPDDYATAGVWYLQSVSADYSQMARNDIDGGDITTSGQVITVAPCSCWDSTRGTFLQTLVNKTWTVPATNNLEVYLFIVRLNNGTIDVKGYSTYTAAAADVGVNITNWRDISWAKNNGSGVLMPYVQVGDRIDWTVQTNRPILSTTIGTSKTSCNLGAVVPVSVCKEVVISKVSLYGFDVSYDNATNVTFSGQPEHTILPVSTVYLTSLSGTTTAEIFSITLRR